MDRVRDRLVIVGMSRLGAEIAASALSLHGWSVLDLEHARLNPAGHSEILLVACPISAREVVALIRQARADFPGRKIVLLGVEGSDTDLVRFIEEGACAFVPANGGLAELIRALERVRNNEASCSGEMAKLVIGTIHRLSRERVAGIESPLTRREKEILHLIRGGLSNKEIATQLHIAPNTVKNHVHHLLEKLKVRSRHHAAWMQFRPDRPAPLALGARSGTDG